MRKLSATVFSVAFVTLSISNAFGLLIDQSCQMSKGKALSKYEACRHKAEQKLVKTADATAYGASLTACDDALADAWSKADAKATAAGTTCPDSPLASSDFKNLIDSTIDDIVSGLHDGALPECGDDDVNVVGEQCDGGDLNATDCTDIGYDCGTLACTSACRFDASGCISGTACLPAPSITQVQPSAGSMYGGTTITLTGTNFGDVSAVSVAGRPAQSFTVDSPTQITAVTAQNVPAIAPVSVTAPGGSVNGPDFQYECDLHLTNEDGNYPVGTNVLESTPEIAIPGVTPRYDWTCEPELGDTNSDGTCQSIENASNNGTSSSSILFNMNPASLVDVTLTLTLQPGSYVCSKMFVIGDLGS